MMSQWEDRSRSGAKAVLIRLVQTLSSLAAGLTRLLELHLLKVLRLEECCHLVHERPVRK